MVADAIRRTAFAIYYGANVLGTRVIAIASIVVAILTVLVAIRCFADALAALQMYRERFQLQTVWLHKQSAYLESD